MTARTTLQPPVAPWIPPRIPPSDGRHRGHRGRAGSRQDEGGPFPRLSLTVPAARPSWPSWILTERYRDIQPDSTKVFNQIQPPKAPVIRAFPRIGRRQVFNRIQPDSTKVFNQIQPPAVLDPVPWTPPSRILTARTTLQPSVAPWIPPRIPRSDGRHRRQRGRLDPARMKAVPSLGSVSPHRQRDRRGRRGSSPSGHNKIKE